MRVSVRNSAGSDYIYEFINLGDIEFINERNEYDEQE